MKCYYVSCGEVIMIVCLVNFSKVWMLVVIVFMVVFVFCIVVIYFSFEIWRLVVKY